jgi:hypothetical protein
MDSNKASSLGQFSFLRVPKALPGLTVLMILLSLVFNLVITFSDLLGSSILKQFLTGLEGMVIAPSFYVLALWGGVYLGLFAVIAYQFGLGYAFPRNHEYWHQPLFQRVNRLIMTAVLCQVLWAALFAAHQAGLATLATVGVLVVLIKIYRALDIGGSRASRHRRWFCHAPISLYLGWATVLTVITAATGLHSTGWLANGVVWGVLVILALALCSAKFIHSYVDFPFTLAIVWGLMMVAAQQQQVEAVNLVSAYASGILVFWLAYLKNPPPQRF